MYHVNHSRKGERQQADYKPKSLMLATRDGDRQAVQSCVDQSLKEYEMQDFPVDSLLFPNIK